MGPLRLLTWNVAGLHDRRLDERTEAQCLAALLRPVPFDAIALQEVVRRSWHAHWKHHLAAAGYRVFPADPTATPSEYFALVAVRDPAATGGIAPFPGTRMGRALVWAELRGWLVLTAHLESERAGGPERVRQAEAVIARLRAHPGPAVFGGDTNLRVAEEPQVGGLAEVDDAWIASGRPAAGRSTWIGGARGARFDRVWCSRGLAVTGFEVLGDASLSDHLGLAVTLAPAG